MQLCSCFFNLALFELYYSSLSDGMALYRSTIHVLALINFYKFNSLGVQGNY